jgi:hypothetical protein
MLILIWVENLKKFLNKVINSVHKERVYNPSKKIKSFVVLLISLFLSYKFITKFILIIVLGSIFCTALHCTTKSNK